MKPITLAAWGDSLTQGIGDRTTLGWLGRLSSALSEGHSVTPYNLGVRGDTTLELSRRISAEAKCRLDPHSHNVSFLCIGTNDSANYRGRLRVPVGRSVQLVKRALDQLQRYGHVLWVSPIPVTSDELIFEPSPGERFLFKSSVLLQYNDAYRELAGQLKLPYLDLFEMSETMDAPVFDTGDGIHPQASGYEALAVTISKWKAFKQAVEKERPTVLNTLSFGSLTLD